MYKFLINICFFLFLVILFGCTEKKNSCKLPISVIKDISKIDSLIKLPEIRRKDSIWKLNNYNEPSLLYSKNETYRFICHGSFGEVEIYRIEKINEKYKVVTKTFVEHKTIHSFNEFYISSETWTNITDSLSISGFWTYPSLIERKGLDGATWILEGYNPIKNECTRMNYHILTRWSPIDNKFISMCNLFTRLKQE